jgi:tetratricopeptide (TPR) repeat protein
MVTKYFCAHCDEEFIPEEAGHKPRCPRCMRRGGVEPVKEEPAGPAVPRRSLIIAAIVLVLAGIGYGAYRFQTVALEDTPPLRPLSARELTAYLERDEIQAGAYASMFVLPDNVEGWSEGPAELARKMNGESSSWSLEQALPRDVLTADQTLAAMAAREDRVKLYPLELATAMTALLRERGVQAMVAEVWEFAGEQAPADPSGMLGYFVTAVYEGGSDQPSAYFDPWGGHGETDPSSARVLRDTEVIAAALGTEATRVFTSSGDSTKALPMVETALELDPVSPSLRVVHATVLVESGGLPQALRELEAAIQLRPDGPRRLNMVQLTLAQAGMLEANGQQAAADAQFARANRAVVDVVDEWPRYGRAHLILATVDLGLGDHERARVELEAAEALSPDSPMLWAVWAQYHLAVDDPASAVAKMNRAIQLDPENWQLRVQAAGIFFGAGDEGAARKQAAEALRLVAPDRRGKLRSYLESMMGPEERPEEPVGESKPVLMLGDPSKLRLRSPDQKLKLDLDE